MFPLPSVLLSKYFKGVLFIAYGLAVMILIPTANAATGTLIPNSTYYPRLVRITHGTPSAIGHIIASTKGEIFESTDDGRSINLLTEAPIRAGSKLLCCATIYELPQTVGSLKAGTLLYAPSVKVGNE